MHMYISESKNESSGEAVKLVVVAFLDLLPISILCHGSCISCLAEKSGLLLIGGGGRHRRLAIREKRQIQRRESESRPTTNKVQ